MKSSGILLHITSLPSAYGAGTLGDAAKFVSFLVAAKQKYWQILPVSPTDFVNSPYASSSTFAGNTLLIDTDKLAAEKLIDEETLSAAKHARGNDYGYAVFNKEKLLRAAFGNFLKNNPPAEYGEFCDANAFWLDDFALFSALKKHFGGASWLEWPDEDARMRNPEVLARYADALSDETDYVKFCQYVFYSQWKDFRALLKSNDISLIGDIPIYVAYDSADVWANPELFCLTKDRRPSVVAGVPPDYFSEDGQLWGNPIYDWQAMKKDGCRWWIERVAKCSELFDVLRIDHFRAFDSYYEIKYGETTARRGTWRKGAGYDFLKTVLDSCPELTVIAEDLGDIPPSVLKLRDKCGLRGMKVMQFGFDGNADNPFLPSNYEEHCVAYLGTHDNDTTAGWWAGLSEESRAYCLRAAGIEDDSRIVRELMRVLAESNAELVIFSMQDVAEKGTESRMNTPGVLGCWKYMAENGDFSNANAKWLAALTEQTGRCGKIRT